MLEITKRESNHELLLSAKNLHELGPSPLSKELVKGEHFILADLLKSIPGSSFQARSAQEPQVETARETSTTFVRPDQSPLAEQNPQPAPQAMKKKKRKKGKKVGQAKAIDAGLEGM